MTQNQLQFIRLAFYRLKRQYGRSVTITRRTSGQRDLETGVAAVSESTYTISKAIKMPELSSSSVEFGAVFRHFRFGAEVTLGSSQYAIDKKDLVFVPMIGDALIDSGVEYAVKDVTDLEGFGYIITAEAHS